MSIQELKAKIKAEFESNPTSQAIFGNFENYWAAVCSDKPLERYFPGCEGMLSERVTSQFRKEWEADPALQAEFGGNLEAFLAFREAESKGQVRIIGDKVITIGR